MTAGDAPAGAIDVRHVRTHDEFAACVALQGDTWGHGFRELVPATILKITQRLGGVTAGAFDADGALLGFVFGFTGVEDGRLAHWSDLLAVRADAQNHGLGRRLKEFQRDAVLALGVTRMYWTFDPLVARNAHFNLNRLGARVREYVPDMYGLDTGSVVHSGVGTDRFIVAWELAEAGGARGGDGASADGDPGPVLNPDPEGGADVDPAAAAGDAARARIAVPADIGALQRERIDAARRWRTTTRRAFEWALARGFVVQGFAAEPGAGPGHYLLARPATR